MLQSLLKNTLVFCYCNITPHNFFSCKYSHTKVASRDYDN